MLWKGSIAEITIRAEPLLELVHQGLGLRKVKTPVIYDICIYIPYCVYSTV